MANSIKILITAKDDASRTLRSVAGEVDRSGDRAKNADRAFAAFGKTIGVGMLAAGAAAAVGIKNAVNSSRDYQSSLSQLKQASSATSGEMGLMAAKARQLGRDNTLAGVTASDAAQTMIELSKAGLSVNDTLAASKGVMSLARAGNIAFSDAAVIAASALNAFGLEGKDANKVADTLAAGANASQAELSDLADGLQQSATVAKQYDLSLNEVTTSLALFANNGIKGSDAGTSLKTMLIALAKPSRQASDAMREIGFKAYDAQGKFVGLDEMSVRLNKSMKGLTKQQQQNALATIFGTDAFRAAAVLADSAGNKYDAMSKKVGQSGAAQKAAAAQMGPYQRATEAASNAMSELGLSIGTRMLPFLTRAANGFTGIVSSINGGLPGAIQTFNTLVPVTQAVTAGIVTFTVVQNGAAVATRALTIAQGALNFAMRANPMALLAGTAVALVGVLMAVANQTDRNKSATDRLNSARRAQVVANDNAKAAEDRLRGAKVSAQGATLAVERAQRSYNEIVRQYGPRSLEAREAANSLKRSELDLRSANDAVREATKRKQQAETEVAQKRQETIKAENGKAAAVQAMKNKVADQRVQVQRLSFDLDQLNGRKVAYSVTANLDQAAAKKNGYKTGVPFQATGTPYASGGATVVGERGPELVNLPRGSRVTQAWKTREIASQSGGGDSGMSIQIHGNVILQDKSAVDSFFKQVDQSQRFARMGMA